MGETYGCCSHYEQRLHEEQLERASRPTKRRTCKSWSKWQDREFNNCCCGCCKRSPKFESERIVMEHDPSPRYDEDTKISEEPSKSRSSHSLIEIEPSKSASYSPKYSTAQIIKNPETTTEMNETIKPKQVVEEIKTQLIQDTMNTATTTIIITAIENKNRFKTVTKDNCLQFLTNFQVIRSVYVPKDKYDRWTLSHMLYKRITICDDLHVPCDENKNDCDYIEMKCFSLKNFEKIYDIKYEEFEDFKRIILEGLTKCKNVYFLNLNSSKCDTVFVGEVLDLLRKRYEEKEKGFYGPELVDIENIPIKNEGLQLVCKYLEADIGYAKWLKIGKCFGYDIPKQIAEEIVDSFERNNNILRMNIELNTKLHQHSQRISEHLKKNSHKWRTERIQRRKMTV